MPLSSIHKILLKLDQQHLLTGIDSLSLEQLQVFARELQKYEPMFFMQREKVLSLHPPSSQSATQCGIAPFNDVLPYRKHEVSGNLDDYEKGKELTCRGKAGCLILAGGQGTRLGFNGPKGLFPVSLIKRKSLFQLFCERVKAASQWLKHPLPLCIMTSTLNHVQTVDFFQEHDCFGLAPTQVCFIQQEMLPFFDDQGRWLLEKPGKIAQGPDGNGHALRLFFNCGFFQKWQKMGIEYLNVISVDNALADPFDFEFVGFAARTGSDISLKAIERFSPDEKMGMLVEQQGHLKVIEYSEAPPSFPHQITLSNTGMFCFSMEFIRYLYQDLNIEAPLHLARKKALVLGLEGVQETIDIWKYERFIFDLLDQSASSSVLVYPRQKIYAPLKNAFGEKSAETVKQALLMRDHEIYHALTGLLPPVSHFELDPSFYYPNEELLLKLRQLYLSDNEYVSF